MSLLFHWYKFTFPSCTAVRCRDSGNGRGKDEKTLAGKKKKYQKTDLHFIDLSLKLSQINTRSYLVRFTDVTYEAIFLFGSNRSFFSAFVHLETFQEEKKHTNDFHFTPPATKWTYLVPRLSLLCLRCRQGKQRERESLVTRLKTDRFGEKIFSTVYVRNQFWDEQIQYFDESLFDIGKQWNVL